MTVGTRQIHLVADDGHVVANDGARWFDPPGPDDLEILERVVGPVIDIGCGPGRIVAHLAGAGIAALGVDVSETAVDHARTAGAPVLHRSVFDPLPGEGRWRTALLLDGNIGIGGDPCRLLARVRSLLDDDGVAIVEVGPPGSGSRTFAAHLVVDGIATPSFPWAEVDAGDVHHVAAGAGLQCGATRRVGERWFADVRARRAPTGSRGSMPGRWQTSP